MSAHPATTGEVSDAERVRRWREQGDDSAIAALWNAYQRTAVYVAARILVRLPNGDEDARDIADEAFLRALDTFDLDKAGATGKPFRAFYMLIARRQALDLLRKRKREVYPVEMPEGEAPPAHEEPELPPLENREVIPRLRKFVLENYLASDWTLFEVWMRYQRDGKRVPWKSIAADHPVELHDVVPFAAGSVDLPEQTDAIDAVVHTMNVCNSIHVEVAGSAAGDEDPALAARRADVVRRAVEARLKQRTTTDRKSRVTEDRVRVAEAPRTGGTHVEFDVVRGRIRSPDALRMRIQKVILEKARELLSGDRS